jgi:hypothetical protein
VHGRSPGDDIAGAQGCVRSGSTHRVRLGGRTGTRCRDPAPVAAARHPFALALKARPAQQPVLNNRHEKARSDGGLFCNQPLR